MENQNTTFLQNDTKYGRILEVFLNQSAWGLSRPYPRTDFTFSVIPMGERGREKGLLFLEDGR